ncbi:MAG: hypothetical protein V1686_01570 [Patescibacteria group bacterium]
MSTEQNNQSWQQNYKSELEKIAPILDNLNIVLDRSQVHVSGERYYTNNKKLVLIGEDVKNKKRVAIKMGLDLDSINEILVEKKCREVLKKINFASHVFLSPEEVFFVNKSDFVVFITAYVEQECTFLERPMQEQFFLALKTFEAQEGLHATTYEHANVISKIFGIWDAKNYLKTFDVYRNEIVSKLPGNNKLKTLLTETFGFLNKNSEIINLYSGFLVHWDFVPHNIRVVGRDVYFLDHSSMRFGNKHESWARFINFMTLYNPELERALIEYIKNNRSQEETLSLQLMRIFRLTELIKYYVSTLGNLSGNILTLNKKRIDFWGNALEAVLHNQLMRKEIIDEYKTTRDSLRSDDEKQRQKNLH